MNYKDIVDYLGEKVEDIYQSNLFSDLSYLSNKLKSKFHLGNNTKFSNPSHKGKFLSIAKNKHYSRRKNIVRKSFKEKDLDEMKVFLENSLVLISSLNEFAEDPQHTSVGESGETNDFADLMYPFLKNILNAILYKMRDYNLKPGETNLAEIVSLIIEEGMAGGSAGSEEDEGGGGH